LENRGLSLILVFDDRHGSVNVRPITIRWISLAPS
jgi:hypothetical protein